MVFGFDVDVGVRCCVWMLMLPPWDYYGDLHFDFRIWHLEYVVDYLDLDF